MKRTHSKARSFLRLAVCAGAVALLSACASDPGEKVADAPFPKLVDVPPRPEASTTQQERAALRTQLKNRRDEINKAAESLLRGGTEPVPVALDTQSPGANSVSTPPPPLPAGLPAPPERPRSLSDTVSGSKAAGGSAPKPDDQEMIEAPGEAQMPPPRAAGSSKEDEESGDQDEEGDSGN